MLQRNTYGTLPDKLMKNELLMHMLSETRGNSLTNLHQQEHFLTEYRTSHIPKALSAANPHLHPSTLTLQKEQKCF